MPPLGVQADSAHVRLCSVRNNTAGSHKTSPPGETWVEKAGLMRLDHLQSAARGQVSVQTRATREVTRMPGALPDKLGARLCDSKVSSTGAAPCHAA